MGPNWFQRTMTWLTGETDWWMTDQYEKVYEDMRTIGRKRKPRWFVTPYNFMHRLYSRVSGQVSYNVSLVTYTPKNWNDYVRLYHVESVAAID